MWGARGEGSTCAGLQACWLWKTTEAWGAGVWAGQASLEPGSAAFALLDSSHPFLCQAGDLLRWVLHQVESTASLPPLPRWLDRPLPLAGPQHPWGKERGWDYRFFEVLPSPDILSIL